MSDKRKCDVCSMEIEWTEQMIGNTCMLCSRNHESMKRREAEAKVLELEKAIQTHARWQCKEKKTCTFNMNDLRLWKLINYDVLED